MPDRRSIYFAFQGLLMSVLLLLFFFHYPGKLGWGIRFAFLAGMLLASLIFVRMAPQKILLSWWVQMCLFLGDTALASLTLYWTRPDSELYLVYFLIIFGTALTRNLIQSLIIAAAASILYIASAWNPALGLPATPEFWLRIQFLWVTTSMLALLSQDTQQAQLEQERQYQEKLIHVKSLATLGQVAGEVAHRIKGPLTTILVNAEVLLHRHRNSKQTLKELSQIQYEVEHCKQILKNLLDLGRIEEMDFAIIDLRNCIRSAIESMEPQLRKKGIRLELGKWTSPLMVRGDQSLLHEALLALLQNAVDASQEDGKIQVRIRTIPSQKWWFKTSSKREYHELIIGDSGVGIDPEDMGNIFKPFFTTKGRAGSGLGLSAALRILEKHGGSIEAHSDGIGQGASFILKLPARKTPAGET